MSAVLTPSRQRDVPLQRRFGSIAPNEPRVPVGARLDRDPCWRCGVRAELGCAHRAPAEAW